MPSAKPPYSLVFTVKMVLLHTLPIKFSPPYRPTKPQHLCFSRSLLASIKKQARRNKSGTLPRSRRQSSGIIKYLYATLNLRRYAPKRRAKTILLSSYSPV